MATSTGPPGTAKAGTNGCISNCGTAIISSATPPNPFRRIGYFEGDNLNRPCVNMDISQVNASAYTHLHFAFATLSSNYEVIVSNDSYTQFEFARFKNITGPIKMLTIGGWDFSTNPDTYMIFRNGMSPANAATLAKNIYSFVVENGLGGVDIDWEYPGVRTWPF
jgi:GH18 family chitinase